MLGLKLKHVSKQGQCSLLPCYLGFDDCFLDGDCLSLDDTLLPISSCAGKLGI